jgi:phospholipid transport system substrate-binding protein
LRYRLLTGLIVVLGLLGPPAGATPVADTVSPQEARSFVQQVQEEVRGLAARGRDGGAFLAAVRGLVFLAFDVDGAARLAAGPAWATATPDQREDYRRLYADWMVETFRSYFVSGRPADMTIFSSEAVPGSGDAYVRFMLSGAAMPSLIGARVRRLGGEPRIIDLASAGISLLKTQRDDFAAVIAKRGFDGLLAELRSKTPAPTMVGGAP